MPHFRNAILGKSKGTQKDNVKCLHTHRIISLRSISPLCIKSEILLIKSKQHISADLSKYPLNAATKPKRFLQYNSVSMIYYVFMLRNKFKISC